MANIDDKVASIRQAIYGKDVRESIASGIEAINDEVESTTGRQNVIDSQEETRINNENTRQLNEAARQNAFTTNENARQTAFNLNEAARIDNYNTNEQARVNAENTRISNEDTRVSEFNTIKSDFENMQHSDATLEVIQARNGEVDLNTRLNKMSDATSDINDLLETGATINPNITYGMNNVIKKTDKTSSSLSLDITGAKLINYLGKDGNCEDVNKWNKYQSTLTLDSTNKIFGNSGIKMTITNSVGSLYRPAILDASKYYLISVYLKNGNATNVYLRKDSTGGGVEINSTLVTAQDKFVRVGILVKPSDLNQSNVVLVNANGTSGQYVYIDGIMVNEITADEYNNMTVDQLLAKYPYVYSYTCLQNPYLEIRRNNLVINGNCEEGVGYWTPTDNSALSIENGKLKITTILNYAGALQRIKVKPNTDYYLSANLGSNSEIHVNTRDNSTRIKTGVGTFNSGNQTEIVLNLYNNVIGIGYFDSIMLVEGTTPTTYKSCEIQKMVIDGKFADGDTVVFKDGGITQSRINKHATLYGKDYDWQYSADYTGFKRLQIPSTSLNLTGITDTQLVKYDGKIIPFRDPTVNSDSQCTHATLNYLVSVADSDSGWTESINPNNDEVKVFMNGWKAVGYDTRYTAWVSVVDGGVPNGAISTTVATAFTNNGTLLVVADASKFAVNDIILIKRDDGTWAGRNITAISSNTITIASLSGTCAVGNPIFKGDISGSNTNLLNYCMNNVAPGYEGYQLHYKLQKPEVTTKAASLLTLEEGENYVYLDSGMVLGEVANPQTDNGNYYINMDRMKYLYAPDNQLKNRSENIFNVYNNKIIDTLWIRNYGIPEAYGREAVSIVKANFDTTATYTVDYKILSTIAPQIGVITSGYSEGIINAINSIQEAVDSRQAKDSVLDSIIDMSLYENIYEDYLAIPQLTSSGNASIVLRIPFKVKKKVLPKLKLQSYQLYYSDMGYNITNKFFINGVLIYKDYVKIIFSTYDATTITNVRSYGVSCSFNITADCRERI